MTDLAALEVTLRERVDGEIRFDAGSRGALSRTPLHLADALLLAVERDRCRGDRHSRSDERPSPPLVTRMGSSPGEVTS